MAESESGRNFNPEKEADWFFKATFAENINQTDALHREFCSLTAEEQKLTIESLASMKNHGKGEFPVLELLYDGHNQMKGFNIDNSYNKHFVDTNCSDKK